MRTIRTNLGVNPASPENFYEEDGVYEAYASAELNENDENDDNFIKEVINNIHPPESIIESDAEKPAAAPAEIDLYANILKDVK